MQSLQASRPDDYCYPRSWQVTFFTPEFRLRTNDSEPPIYGDATGGSAFFCFVPHSPEFKSQTVVFSVLLKPLFAVAQS